MNRLGLLWLLPLFVALNAFAMDARVAGNQLILSGGISGNELALMRDILPLNPQIDTVVLKDSSGGDVWTALRLGELFQERGFKTAVSGYCMSACVAVFLGGVERMFADGKEGRYTQIVVHTPTYSGESSLRSKGDPAPIARQQLLYWMGPRVKDVALLERGLSNSNPAAMLYLFDPARKSRRGDCFSVQRHRKTESGRLRTDRRQGRVSSRIHHHDDDSAGQLKYQPCVKQ